MIQKLIKSIGRILPLLALVLVVLQIIVANELAGAGLEFSKVDKQIVHFADENDLLEMKIASASSLLTLEEKAREVGFIDPKKDSVLTDRMSELPIALQHE